MRTPVSYIRDLVTDSLRIPAAIINNLRATMRNIAMRFIRSVRRTQLTKRIISIVRARMCVCVGVCVGLRMIQLPLIDAIVQQFAQLVSIA